MSDVFQFGCYLYLLGMLAQAISTSNEIVWRNSIAFHIVQIRYVPIKFVTLHI